MQTETDKRGRKPSFPPPGREFFEAEIEVPEPLSERARAQSVFFALGNFLQQFGCKIILYGEAQCPVSMDSAECSLQLGSPTIRFGVQFPENRRLEIGRSIRELAKSQPADVATDSLILIADQLEGKDVTSVGCE